MRGPGGGRREPAPMAAWLHALRPHWETLRAIFATPFWRRAGKVLRIVAMAGIALWLFFRVEAIGWDRIWRSLPLDPWFYILFVLRYLTLPVSEALIYSRLWSLRPLADFPVLLKKSVLNFGVLGMSGEAWFALWARQRGLADTGGVLKALKDVNILSAAVSTFATVLFFVWALATGQLRRFGFGGAAEGAAAGALGWEIGLAAGLSALVIIALVAMRRRVLSLPGPDLRAITGLHAGRLAINYVLQIAQWAVIIPEAPLYVWVLFIGAELLITRIPLLPKQDLVVLSVGVSLLSVLDVPEARMVAMLLANAILTQIAHFVVFVGASVVPVGPAERKTG